MIEVSKLYESLEDDERIILYSIGALNNTPLTGKTKLQKLLFMVSEVFVNLKDLLDFDDYLLGPYSEKIDAILENLVKLDLVTNEKSKYYLSSIGLEIFKRIKPKENLSSVIIDFKELLHDVPEDYLLIFIYVTYPEYKFESSKWEELQSKRLDAAIYLLKNDKVSFSKANEISGLNIDHFTDELKKRKVRWRK
ncbi:MAG: UPF0175 family protein [Candidatus Heimdallarchaeota archaeon]